MPATVTLSTVTLTYGVSATDRTISLSSTSGLTPGKRLFVDKELMAVISTPSSTIAEVRRGVDGTAAAAHGSSSTVTIGDADQFFAHDPFNAPMSAIRVSPYINALNGKVFLAQGDVEQFPGQPVYRWWQEVTNTYGQGALGVRTQTSDPTSST